MRGESLLSGKGFILRRLDQGVTQEIGVEAGSGSGSLREYADGRGKEKADGSG